MDDDLKEETTKDIRDILNFLQEKGHSEEEAINLLLLSFAAMTDSLIFKMQENYYNIDIENSVQSEEYKRLTQVIIKVVKDLTPLLPSEKY